MRPGGRSAESGPSPGPAEALRGLWAWQVGERVRLARVIAGRPANAVGQSLDA